MHKGKRMLDSDYKETASVCVWCADPDNSQQCTRTVRVPSTVHVQHAKSPIPRRQPSQSHTDKQKQADPASPEHRAAPARFVGCFT